MESTAQNIRTGLRYKVADLILANRVAEIATLADENPLNWLMDRPPNYLGELDYRHGPATWTMGIRYFDFTGARTTVFAPAVAWLASDRLSLGLRYALSWTESNAVPSGERGHSAHLHGGYRLYPRVSLQAGYAAGVEEFENFSIDRIGDFRANAASGGVRIDLATLTTLIGHYEHQWRKGGVDMGRLTVSLAQRF